MSAMIPRNPYLRRALAAATLLLASTSAFAQQAHLGVQTTTLSSWTVTVAPYATTIWETRNLTAGTDTVLHVWDPATQTELAFNDDALGTDASRTSYYNPRPTPITLLLVLRSYSNTSQGSASVYSNGVVLAASAPVGGTRVTIACGTPYRVSTVLQPGGARDTVLVGLDAYGRMRAYDDNNGVGAASQLQVRSDVCGAVVAPAAGAANGLANVYANDTTRDGDRDGVGDGLEAALGMCPGAWCAVNPSDTDRDGLRDDAEVFGIDDATAPQLLPAWGANPLHKDVFVELDYSDAFASQPFTGADAAAVQDYFDDALAWEVGNPDLRPGVSLHLDIGVDSVGAADLTLYGNWGGANPVPAAFGYQDAPTLYRARARDGVFHSALVGRGNGGGQADTPGDRLGWGAEVADRRVPTFAHELAHNMDLQHYGHADWGAANCKPNYRSIMNYVYHDLGFTRGDGFASLNPAGLSETVGMGPGMAPSFLSGDPYYFTTSADAVDWNRDGVYDTGIGGFLPFRFIRAAPTWATWNSCGALAMNEARLAEVPLAAAPSLARRSRELFAFWVGPDNRIHYRHGNVGSNPMYGSCPGGDSLGDECMTWGPDTTLATVQNAISVSALGWGSSLMVAYRDTSNAVRVLRSPTEDAYHNPTGWSPAAQVGTAQTTFEPELGLMRVDPARYGASEVLALVYRDRSTTGYKWYTQTTAGGAWTSRGNVVKTGNIAMAGVRSPSLAAMGSGAGRETCGAFTQSDNKVHIYCFDVAGNAWAERTTPFPHTSWADNTAKPGFAYHIHRDLWGQPIHGDATEGQFELAVRRSTGMPDVMITNTLSSSRLPSSNLAFTRLGRAKDEWTVTPLNVGVELFEDLPTGALKMAIPWNGGDWPLTFHPLADGSFRADLTSGNDFFLMERGVCLGLHDETWCGDRSTASNGY